MQAQADHETIWTIDLPGEAATLDLADWVKAFKLIEERTVVGKAVLVP